MGGISVLLLDEGVERASTFAVLGSLVSNGALI
jgi:hypothetical protein